MSKGRQKDLTPNTVFVGLAQKGGGLKMQYNDANGVRHSANVVFSVVNNKLTMASTVNEDVPAAVVEVVEEELVTV